MGYYKKFSEYCDMLIKQYSVTIHSQNLVHSEKQLQVKNMYDSHVQKLIKLFNKEIENIGTYAQVDSKQLINISRDKLREFKYQTQESFEDVQL